MHFQHISVLLDETVKNLLTDNKGIYMDCTLGGAGHGLKICELLQPEGRYIGIDRDPAAIKTATSKLSKVSCKVDLIKANFSQLGLVKEQLGLDEIHGVVFDLGVSSHQLDTADRGFSYMHDGPLDMRMDPADEISAYDVVNSYNEKQLVQIIIEYGEEKWARRIGAFVVAARKESPIRTTGQLVEIIKCAVPAAARREGPHPAKRTFQAIRIEVNGELAILRQALIDAVQLLRSGGRICVITFHSLEDRIVKRTFKELAITCTCPPGFPICVCETTPLLRMAGKPIKPSPQEIENNPRARSATLRVAEKL